MWPECMYSSGGGGGGGGDSGGGRRKRPCRRHPGGVDSRHCTNVDVDRIKPILNVQLFKNLNHFFNQKGSPFPPLSHVLMIHPMSHPY